jgi:hypothetical protein
MMPRGFVDRDDVERADGVGNALLINHHNGFGMHGNKVLVRYANLFAAGQFQRERAKSVLESASDLLDDHATNLPPRFAKEKHFRAQNLSS